MSRVRVEGGGSKEQTARVRVLIAMGEMRKLGQGIYLYGGSRGQVRAGCSSIAAFLHITLVKPCRDCLTTSSVVPQLEEWVLIPRPQTEAIVDLVDAAVKSDEELRDGCWADLGTGSGTLTIAIARILGGGGGGGGGGGRVVAIDLSPIAVAVASYNDLRGELSGLVSDPSYIPSDDIDGLQAEVSRHEPRLALDGGPNGMNDLIHLCNGAASMLKPRVFFAFETNGEMQSKFLVEYMDTKMKGSFAD
ncbi:RNA methyltransferase family protein [Perilla frutescens var. hirtella]|nr:RNA methyltransferase family protein [Perilla frutescens var. hirtella]